MVLSDPEEDDAQAEGALSVQDPFDHLWGVATHIENVAPQELQERAKKAMRAA